MTSSLLLSGGFCGMGRVYPTRLESGSGTRGGASTPAPRTAPPPRRCRPPPAGSVPGRALLPRPTAHKRAPSPRAPGPVAGGPGRTSTAITPSQPSSTAPRPTATTRPPSRSSAKPTRSCRVSSARPVPSRPARPGTAPASVTRACVGDLDLGLDARPSGGSWSSRADVHVACGCRSPTPLAEFGVEQPPRLDRDLELQRQPALGVPVVRPASASSSGSPGGAQRQHRVRPAGEPVRRPAAASRPSVLGLLGAQAARRQRVEREFVPRSTAGRGLRVRDRSSGDLDRSVPASRSRRSSRPARPGRRPRRRTRAGRVGGPRW